MFPLYKLGAFGFEGSLIAAVLLGFGFGFVLERAGFGSAKILAAQFYFTNMRVFKVMFTAIVTAMLGVYYLSWVGLLDVSLVYTTETFWIPQIVGGLILGFGFIVGGYCPGTSVAAVASGKIDAVVFVAGVGVGSLVFNEAWPLVSKLYAITPKGRFLLTEALHLSYGTLVLLVTLMALGGFAAAEWGEKAMARRAAAKGGAA
jgi:uncharacterized membrane protein YedE/YeeE